MRHPISVMIAFFVASALAASGCVIKNAEGKDIFRLDLGGKKDAQAPGEKPSDQEKEKAEAGQAPSEAAKVEEAKKELPGKPEAQKAGPEKAAEDNSDAPWWVKPRGNEGKITQKTLAEEGKGAQAPAGETTGEKPPAPTDQDAGLVGPGGEQVPPAEENKPQDQSPQAVQVDRHLNQIPSALWNDTYKRQTSKKSSPSRRASMAQVKQGIETGYGPAYVSKMEKAISLDRTNGYAYYFLARGRFEKADWKRAQTFAESAVSKLSGDLKFRSAARVLLSKCLTNQGNAEEAARQANEAAADDPENTEAKVLVLRFTQQ